MYKYLLPTLTALVLTATVSGADLSKDEKKQIKTQLKAFKKDPGKFKSMIAKYKETIDSNESDLAKRKNTIDQLSASYADMQKKLAASEADLKTCQSKPEPKCPEPVNPLAIPTTGTVYKVQLGLYRHFDMNSFFDKPKYVGFEKSGGLNRYIVSYFDDKQEAERFAGDLRKLGLHDAFVAKYADGERVYEKDFKKKAKVKRAPAKTE